MNFLGVIEDISDKEYQKRVWIRGEGPEVDDFTEAVCYFSDMEFILENYEEYPITKEQYQILDKFRNAFDEFIDGPRPGYLPQEFIDTPEWTKITEMAKEVLTAFDYKAG